MNVFISAALKLTEIVFRDLFSINIMVGIYIVTNMAIN